MQAYLGDFPQQLFTDKEPKEAIEKFKRDLKIYAEGVRKRNGDIMYPYDWLLPEKISNGIAM